MAPGSPFHLFSSRERGTKKKQSSTHPITKSTLISFFKSACNDYSEESRSDLGRTPRNTFPVGLNLRSIFVHVSTLHLFNFSVSPCFFCFSFESNLSLLYTQIHLHFFLPVLAVDMKMEYEYVWWRSKDIAYGEPPCIMQLFLSHLHSFRHTHMHTHTARTEIHTITCMEKQGYKIPLPPALFLL